ncbi:hypothetical protein [Pseudomonas fontis]|uniref:DUF4234 domain-containing protein n=1 Tax=Pseudomonas fontis TaxID=2942633 RepID=A0ABT5NYK0_9PSED|nr:hypothetical protein [Pseudomonas fontis]MDD0977268.1 hypothetical protein [Pseudomonas fontis]MDD0993286.1 hypothetical protein [Pseudomonas fontis]
MNTTEIPSTASPAPSLFVYVPMRMFVVLSVVTLGLYWYVWFYRNWARYNEVKGLDLIPLLRCLFPIFFVYGLCRKVDRYVKATGREHEWSPDDAAIAYIALSVGLWLVSNFMAVGSVLFAVITLVVFIHQIWALANVQRAINAAQEEGGCEEGE